MSDFLEYAKANQHSGNCTRAEAFTMGQRSRQSEIDQLKAEKEGLEKRIYSALMLLQRNQLYIPALAMEQIGKVLRGES